MSEPLNILVIEDRNADFLMVERQFMQKGLAASCCRVDSLEGLKEAITREGWDLVLTDYSIPHFNFLDGLNLIKEALPALPVIMVTGTLGDEKAVELLKLGVWDFVLKDNLARLIPAIQRSLKEKRELEERRRAEEALRISEERLNLALRGANDGLWDWNLKTDELYCSPRWISMLGYTDEEQGISFDTWKRFLHPEDIEPSLTRLRDYREGHTPKYEVEFRMLHKEGHYVDILSRGFLLYDDHGEALRMVGTHVDITERRKLEEQFRQAQKMEAVGQLAGGVAHDFNNILTAMMGYCTLIELNTTVGDTVRGYMEKLLLAIERAASLTKGLLVYSRKQPLNRQPFELNSIIRKVEHLLSRLLCEDIELAFILAGEPLTVMADCHQIEQVLMNLATNARDAMPAGGVLRIVTSRLDLTPAFVKSHGFGMPGKYALLEVSDSGVGMDVAIKERIFEPFFTTKEVGKGTGLGLSSCYAVIKQHNGYINVYSKPGAGTTFTIYLPLIDGKESVVPSKEPRKKGTGNETILLVEDDAEIRGALKELLEDSGYTIIEAVDGEDGIRKFRENEHSVQLLILDMIMPKKSGKEIYEEIAKLRPGIKVIFLSGYTADMLNARGMSQADLNFVPKPFSINTLQEKVREVLDI